MSNKTETPVAVVPENVEQLEESTPKPNLRTRATRFVKAHKKSTIAVGALVSLIGLAAVAGRGKDDDVDFNQPFDLPEDETDEVQSDDTTVA